MPDKLTPSHPGTPGSLVASVYSDRHILGAAAAAEVAEALRLRLQEAGSVRVIFACAPSQDAFLAELVRAPGVAWDKITAFHMDEYVGLPATHPASFRHYLRTRLCHQVTLAGCHELAGDASIPVECDRYGHLLAQAPIDFVLLGIGENGHIAFNDPPVADFNDPQAVKCVELDPGCRQQQVNDGCFPNLDAVPRSALTLTIPRLLTARQLFCIVPGVRKAMAVRATLQDPISTACPATVLRTHPKVRLFLDSQSATHVYQNPEAHPTNPITFTQFASTT